MIHARFTWTENRQAIRISNQFVTDGKPAPYVDEFDEIHAAGGKVDQLVARVTPHGSESWDNTIFARNGDTLTPLVQVQYLAAQ